MIRVVMGVVGVVLLVVLAVVVGLPDRLLPGEDAPPTAMLEVGSCFVVDAAGRVLPERCTERNDGTVIAEVADVEVCEPLGDGVPVAFVTVEGRTFCLSDR